MRPVLDSSSFVPVPTLPCKLATILLLAFLLFELVATLSHFLCSKSNKKNGEAGDYPQEAKIFFNKQNFLITGYVQVRTYDFHCKMCNNKMFFSLLMQRFDGKAWFLLFSHSFKLYMILYRTGTVFFHCCIFSWGLG